MAQVEYPHQQDGYFDPFISPRGELPSDDVIRKKKKENVSADNGARARLSRVVCCVSIQGERKNEEEDEGRRGDKERE